MESHIQTRPVNRPLLIAAGLMTLTVLVHAFVGGPEVYDPVRDSAITPVARSVTSVVWHVITAVLAIMAAGLFWVSRHRCRPLEVMLIAIQLSFAGIFIGYGLADFGSLLPMPQWIIFLIGPALMVFAGAEHDQTSS